MYNPEFNRQDIPQQPHELFPNTDTRRQNIDEENDDDDPPLQIPVNKQISFYLRHRGKAPEGISTEDYQAIRTSQDPAQLLFTLYPEFYSSLKSQIEAKDFPRKQAKPEQEPIKNEGQNTRRIKETLSFIQSIQLTEQESEIEKIKLEEAKKTAQRMISELLSKAKEYIDYVAYSDQKSKSIPLQFSDPKDRREKAIELNDTRSEKHNALIDQLQDTLRFISYNFNVIAPSAEQKWKETLAQEGKTPLKIKRIPFPAGILCPESLNIRDRKQIAKWAFDLTKELQISGVDSLFR
jgi:hypothetical protein